MDEVTQILSAIEGGEPHAADELLPLVYTELRRLAASKMAGEREGHTLQPTALVHEAWLRLVGPDGEHRDWNSRTHFFCAAAEAMRRVLIEHARKKKRLKRGGDLARTTLNESGLAFESPSEEVLAVGEAVRKLEDEDPELARIVNLRYFVGLTVAETAAALNTSASSVKRSWRCARAWLFREITGAPPQSPG